tara:strand:- start:471 stop:947 length:477 start_codon:yes stop_codon:yes gene_type:complete
MRHRWHCHQSELRNSRHPNHQLQEDWNQFGKEQFVFEVLKKMPPDSEKIEIRKEELETLHRFQLQKIKLYNVLNVINTGTKEKQCTKCKKIYPREKEHFDKAYSLANGAVFVSQCKECRRARRRAYKRKLLTIKLRKRLDKQPQPVILYKQMEDKCIR